MTTSTSGADTLRAAAAALDRIAELVAARALLDAEILATVRAALAADLDRSAIAAAVGMTRDGLYKWLRRKALRETP